MYIIGEIGVNWDGNFDLLKEMMNQAKKSGCDSVKFQAFNEKLVHNHKQSSRLMKSAIAENNIEEIDKLSKSVGIEWFCTPMYVEAVELLDPFVHRFKIREYDSKPLLQNKSTPLLEKILETGKEVLISSEANPRNSKFFNNSQIKWLYCVPKYPCEISDINFKELHDFDGFSNHCNNIIAPLTAAILGAKIIEIHISSDKTGDFIDNKVSFDYKELFELVDLIHNSEKIKK